MRLEKDSILKVRDKKVILTGDVNILGNEHGYFILNFWQPDL